MAKKKTVKTENKEPVIKEVKPKKQTRGILLLAIKHMNFGRMAENLAITIKQASPSMPITLACDAQGLSDIKYKGIFDKIITVPIDYYLHNGMFHAIKAKTFLYNLTPYDETLYFDADMLWLPHHNVEKLFDSQKGKFNIKNTGKVNLDGDFPDAYTWWTPSLTNVKEVYNLTGDYYSLSSEVIYFKKDKDVQNLFKEAQKLYDFKAKYLPFAGGVPDELLFSVAMCKIGIYPSKFQWIPSYWEDAEKRNLNREDMYKDYYLYSIGGKVQMSFVKKLYNEVVQAAYKNAGYVHPFLLTKATEKRMWLPERTNI